MLKKISKHERLAQFLERKKVATMQELKQVTSATVSMTVYRMLKKLSYLTSYSHNGRYYALKKTVTFDDQGRWSFRSIRFSEYGTRLKTLESAVSDSNGGCFAQELEKRLNLGVKESLLRLVQRGKLVREKVFGSYLYCAKHSTVRRQQLAVRHAERSGFGSGIIFEPDKVSDEVKAAIILFMALLNQRQRRLFAGIEAIQFGSEAETWIAHLLGIHPQTVAKGKKELLEGRVDGNGIRKIRSRNTPHGKKTPQRYEEIQTLMDPDTAAAAISGLKWTRKSTAKISKALAQIGRQVSRNTVGKLLKSMSFRLRVNHKKRSTASPHDRDKQFKRIKRMRNTFTLQGDPVISVDSKKKELVGNFKNAGVAWKQEAIETFDPDFRSLALGIAIPYGRYEPILNRGFVVLGTSKEPPGFAVDSLINGWLLEGKKQYPHSKRWLILAEGGGGNASNSRVWKAPLQSKFCDRFGIKITGCHYPPGTSKWNPIEHFLFSHISKNWASEPLVSYEKMLNYIRTTTTETGLKVRAQLNTKTDEKGVSISNEEMKRLYIQKHPQLPKWNYTIKPRN